MSSFVLCLSVIRRSVKLKTGPKYSIDGRSGNQSIMRSFYGRHKEALVNVEKIRYRYFPKYALEIHSCTLTPSHLTLSEANGIFQFKKMRLILAIKAKDFLRGHDDLASFWLKVSFLSRV